MNFMILLKLHVFIGMTSTPMIILVLGQRLIKNLEKIGTEMTTYLNISKQLNLVSVRAIQLQESFLKLRKPSTKFGMMGFSLS